ncbi:hypothetical protein JCM8202_001752 [Rhodotorula sphaerocarpa]
MPAPSHPAVGSHLVVQFPAPKVLLLRLNRPEALNAMTADLEADLCKMFDWFEEENSLWVVIVTGTGRAFCAGQDLKNWQKTAGTSSSPDENMAKNKHGFGSMSRRRFKKPFICALNGFAYGGGGEALVNADIIIACEGCKVGFPEVKRGVVAGVGGIPNALRRSPQLGPYLLTGEPIPPHLLAAHVFTETVPTADVLPIALRWAAKLVEASPDAVWATKEHMNQHKDGMGVSAAVDAALKTDVSKSVFRGENIQEGLRAFVEKREPVWRDPVRRDSKL